MDHPAAKVLAVLELLQTHRQMSGAELAGRLAVDRRTVRRYISLLETVGIPVTTERGPHGGYALLPGFKLPPLMFTGDEALAVALGLAAAGGLGLADSARAIAGAQAKLERVMPEALKRRLRAVAESVVFARGPTPAVAATVLPALTAGAHAGHGVRLRYQNHDGQVTERDFDPYGLAFHGGRWYTAGYCHLRNSLRTFRLDRVLDVAEQSRPFERPGRFDVVRHVAVALATVPRRYTIEVILDTDLATATASLFDAIGVMEPAGQRVRMQSTADDLDWFARELARLPFAFEVRKPSELRAAVRRLGKLLLSRG